MPSQHCRGTLRANASANFAEILIVSATKGLEEGSLLRMSEVIRLVLEREMLRSAHSVAPHSHRKSLAEIPPPSPLHRRMPTFFEQCSRNSAIPDFGSTPTATWSAWNWAVRLKISLR